MAPPSGFSELRGVDTALGRVTLATLLQTGDQGEYGTGTDTPVPGIAPVPPPAGAGPHADPGRARPRARHARARDRTRPARRRHEWLNRSPSSWRRATRP